MECFNEGYITEKFAYLVIGEPWNEDDSYIIFSVCDCKDLADSFCEKVNFEVGDEIRRVYVSEYPLNCIVNLKL